MNIKLKRTSQIATGLAGLAIAITACGPSGNPSSNTTEHNDQSQDSSNLINNQPPPIYKYSQIRQTVIDAQDIEANGVHTTTLFYEGMNKVPVFSCPSIGEPVPDSASLTNPTQVVRTSDSNGGYNSNEIDQMDPNGIYAPTQSTGTLVICLNSAGQQYLVRWEGTADAFTSGVSVDKSTGDITVNGAPTAQLHDKKGNPTK